MSTFDLTSKHGQSSLIARIGTALDTALDALFNTYHVNKMASIKTKELKGLSDAQLARIGVNRKDIPTYARQLVRQRYVGL